MVAINLKHLEVLAILPSTRDVETQPPPMRDRSLLYGAGVALLKNNLGALAGPPGRHQIIDRLDKAVLPQVLQREARSRWRVRIRPGDIATYKVGGPPVVFYGVSPERHPTSRWAFDRIPGAS